MTHREALKRHEHEVLRFARLELAAGKDHEAVVEHVALRCWMEERFVDALQDQLDPLDAAALENVSVPGRAGQDELEMRGVVPRLLIDGRVLEKRRGQLRVRADTLGAG